MDSEPASNCLGIGNERPGGARTGNRTEREEQTDSLNAHQKPRTMAGENASMGGDLATYHKRRNHGRLGVHDMKNTKSGSATHRTQAEWWKLARRLEAIIYADNNLNPFGTPLDDAAAKWRLRNYPAAAATKKALLACIAYTLSATRRVITDDDAQEVLEILHRWRSESKAE